MFIPFYSDDIAEYSVAIRGLTSHAKKSFTHCVLNSVLPV